MHILVITEQRNGKIKKSAFEALTAAKKTGAHVTALVIGKDVENCDEPGKYGAEKILVANHDKLALYGTASYSKVAAEAVKSTQPDAVFLIASTMGKDLAPYLAFRLGVSAISDCTELFIEDGSIKVKRPVYAGKAFLTVNIKDRPAIVTLRPNTFPPEENPVTPEVSDFEVEFLDVDLKALVKELKATESTRPELTEAEIIISGGRGMKGPENYKIIEELADLLGAAVGASRAAVDAGWRPQSDQVGQTGKTVSPKLYIACGISGAIQHLAGMSSSKCIVAINKDPEAPIFKVADYGIVGDLFDVVPRLTEELKKVL